MHHRPTTCQGKHSNNFTRYLTRHFGHTATIATADNGFANIPIRHGFRVMICKQNFSSTALDWNRLKILFKINIDFKTCKFKPKRFSKIFFAVRSKKMQFFINSWRSNDSNALPGAKLGCSQPPTVLGNPRLSCSSPELGQPIYRLLLAERSSFMSSSLEKGHLLNIWAHRLPSFFSAPTKAASWYLPAAVPVSCSKVGG